MHAAFAGCKVSQADSEAVLASLARRGCRPVADPAQADVQVVLTCGVTGEAERSSRQLARRLAVHGRPVVVAGCAAALRPEQFAGPDLCVAGPGEGVAADPEAVAACVLETAGSRGLVPAAPAAPAAAVSQAAVAAPAGAAARTRTRFTLKAQDGCAGSCSYCAVRLVRGRPWSLAAGEAVEQARAALAAGCGEIVLSGIDVGAYRDAASGDDLAGLVRRLVKLPALRRLRLSSIEPRHLTADLIEAIAEPLVARHLHVPLQSADDGVLAVMGRPYTWEDYRAAVEAARRRLPGLALSTDLIVGFPAEDEAAFERSLAAVADGLFSRVHVFSYSPRAGTAAAELRPLPPATVKRRARLAREAAG
ncbi:MAG TPA: MiaB/RimO family radical SAM methylthiotransferase, partial [Thermoleophilia bacterium]|nr:MiaB/RimO family radical SAM methylthiotransferase [Thermoleophilia bacterium]